MSKKAIELLLDFLLEFVGVLLEVVSDRAIGIFFYIVFALEMVMIAAMTAMSLSEAESMAEMVFISTQCAICFVVIIAAAYVIGVVFFHWNDDKNTKNTTKVGVGYEKVD